jgi:Family of unknown function (DUF5996)
MTENSLWPDLPLEAWRETCETLHRWTQVIGKVQLAFTPLVNHWWNVTFLVTPRGLTTPAIVCGHKSFRIQFDFIDHMLRTDTSDGATETLALAPMSVADFYRAVMERLRGLGIGVHIWTMPCEIEGAVAFEKDFSNAQYDPGYANRFLRTLQQSDRLFKIFRTRFLGKASPVHFFWGSFDLAVTRFSGRTAPPPKGVTPNVAAWVMTEAYSHEVSSCGFWPGNGGYGRAAYYVYAYPEPKGYGEAPLKTPGGFYDKNVGQFILPYDTVRTATDPDALLLGFLQETYTAAADLAKWDRTALERRES